MKTMTIKGANNKSMKPVAYLGGHWAMASPLWQKKIFTIGKILKTYFDPPLCEH